VEDEDMGKKTEGIFRSFDNFCEKAGIVVSLLSVVMMLLVVVTVFMRYVLNIAFIWSYPLSRQLFAFFILFAALYALVTDSHLRIEILYTRFSRKWRLAADIIDLAAFLIFIGVLVWQSSLIARNSVANLELTQGTPKLPLYIIKSILPLMALLLLLQGISFFYRHTIKKGKAPPGMETLGAPRDIVEDVRDQADEHQS
jgi:TRAP-type mannitol/chloroaromatic compound transport system permease small subunit